MICLRILGDIDNTALDNELRAALGEQGKPQRWYTSGAQGEHTVFFDDSIDEKAVQAVLDAHLAAAPKRDHNDPIDDKIVAVEEANRLTARGERESVTALAILCDKLNVIIDQIAAALPPGTVIDRLPDLKMNVGMKRLLEADTAIRELRKGRMP